MARFIIIQRFLTNVTVNLARIGIAWQGSLDFKMALVDGQALNASGAEGGPIVYGYEFPPAVAG